MISSLLRRFDSCLCQYTSVYILQLYDPHALFHIETVYLYLYEGVAAQYHYLC